MLPLPQPRPRYPVPFTEMIKRERPRRLLIVGTAIALALALAAGDAWHPLQTAAARNSVNVLSPTPTTFDPAVQDDTGTAQVVSQLFESLTAVDAVATVQPALAGSWETLDGGMRVVFHLRPGLTFSDGSQLKASNVVSSWMRVLAPATASPLASLLDEVAGARAYREGSGPASAVGIHATGDTDVEVDMAAATYDFPAIVSSPTLAVVPPGIDSNPSILQPGTFVGSGGYVLTADRASELTLSANPHYWAGTPPIATVHLLPSAGSTSDIAAFEAGDLDYAPLSPPFGDATWIAYDKILGPSLRMESSPSVEYYGFDTSKAPFSDVHVRRAFEYGIDWQRMVTLLGVPGMVPATGMVPLGVPGHSTTNFGPTFDLAKAKSELAAAGYPNGTGFPNITLATIGEEPGLEGAIVRQLKDNLGITISLRIMADGNAYNQELANDPPAFWWMDWVADYPGAGDFLSLLLGSGQPTNFGRWSNGDFDAAVAHALATGDSASAQAAFDQAQSIVQDQAPVIPVDYGVGYALAAKGLLGALPNSEGLVRYAGMAWAPGS